MEKEKPHFNEENSDSVFNPKMETVGDLKEFKENRKFIAAKRIANEILNNL